MSTSNFTTHIIERPRMTQAVHISRIAYKYSSMNRWLKYFKHPIPGHTIALSQPSACYRTYNASEHSTYIVHHNDDSYIHRVTRFHNENSCTAARNAEEAKQALSAENPCRVH